MKKWTQDEIQLLTENRAKTPDDVYSLFEGRSLSSVRIKMRRMGYYKPKGPFKWTKQDRDLLAKLWPTATKEELRLAFPGVQHHALSEMARKAGIKRLVQFRKGSLEKLLEETPEAYYWIGMLYSDGWISNTGQVVLGLSTKDKDHLEKFCNFLDTKMLIVIGSGYSKTGVHCRVSVQDSDLGLKLKEKINYPTSPKTYTPPVNFKFLNSDKKLLSFIAGFIDGDGSVNLDGSIKIQLHRNWEMALRELECKLALLEIDCKVKLEACKPSTSTMVINRKNSIYLKTLVSELRLPLMERKWDRI